MFPSLCVSPVVYGWEGHGASVHGLAGWWWQWDLVVVVDAAQRPALIGHHGPASGLVLPSSSSSSGPVAGSHLSSQGAGRRAGVGVGVARVVHGVGVVVRVGTVTPGGERTEAVSEA